MTYREDIVIGDSGHATFHNDTNKALNHVIFAKQYGVTADGITNDTTALQSAIDAANGKRLILPAGDIVLSTPISLLARERSGDARCKVASIEGQGINTTVLKPVTTAIDIDVSDGNISFLKMCDFKIDGGSKGIYIHGEPTLEHTGIFSDCSFDRLKLINQSSIGVHTTCEFIQNVFNHVIVTGSTTSPNYGVHLAGSHAKFRDLFRDCAFRGTLLAGFYADSSTGSATAELAFENCTFESNFRNALRLNRARNVTLRGGYFENNNRDSGGYADVHIESISASYPVFFLTFDQCGGSYDLGVEQPQIFLYAADSGDLENVLINMCSIGGYEIHADGKITSDNIIGLTGSVIRSIPEVILL